MPGAPRRFRFRSERGGTCGPLVRRKCSTQDQLFSNNSDKRVAGSWSDPNIRIRPGSHVCETRNQGIASNSLIPVVFPGCPGGKSATGITRVGLSELLQIGLRAGLQLTFGLAGRSKHVEVILESRTHAAPALVLRAQGFFDNVIDRSHLKGERRGRSSGGVQSARIQVQNCWRRRHPRATSGSELLAFRNEQDFHCGLKSQQGNK